MACLQNGTTLLNNNNLSSFKHNIMKYDETHANVYTSQINNFLNNQIPFRNNHTKDKTQSDNNVYNEHKEIKDGVEKEKEKQTKERDQEQEEEYEGGNDNEDVEALHSCANNKTTTNKSEKQNDAVKTTKHPNKFHFFKSERPNVNGDDVWIESSRNASDNDDNSYQKEKDKEFPCDKGTKNESQGSTQTPISAESGEPSHHARRPMNAFLIFCKRHRTIVKNRYPHLENRAVTKILGEWWAGLEPEDKACYTELAKQYKNAFFSANPNFKWYKLPAPPLRTLHTRPGNIVKSPPPPKEPQEVEEQPQQLFTPGKLADETQLGSITSLINSNNQHCSSVTKNNNSSLASASVSNNTETLNEDEQPDVLSPVNSDNYKDYLLSPPNSNMITMCQPPKPLKKRLVSPQNTPTTTDAKSIVRSIFSSTNDTGNKTDGNIFDSSLLQQALQSFVIDETFEGDFNLDFRALNNNTNSNLTQQELINKVVDHMCSSKTDSNDSNPDELDEECNTCMQNLDEARGGETRKSVRSCKGLLYAKFMAEGKLFVSKRNRKNLSLTTTTSSVTTKLPKPPSFGSSTASDKVPRNTEPIELSDTIKKLAERTIMGGSPAKMTQTATTTPYNMKTMDHQYQNEITQESREETMKKMFRAADFNLDEKIEALPSLSLDKFQQKKKENKKRKFLRATKMKDHNTNEQRKKITEPNTRSEHDDKNAVNLIGSRKRKPIGKPRKQSERAVEDNKQNLNNNNNSSNNNNNNVKVDVDVDETTSSEIDLFGLATLAEVAAKKAKIDQNE